jgi:hypothetical protein
MISEAVLTGGALLVTVVSSSLGVPNALHRPPWQPKGGAFSIWGLIYLSLAVTSWLLRQIPRGDYAFAAFLSASLLCCAGWIVAVRYVGLPLSTFFICMANVCATCAVATIDIRSNEWREGVLGIGPGLLAGWLGLASSLGANQLYFERWDRDLPPWALLLGAAPAACASVAAKTPSTGVCLVWGAAWLPAAVGWVKLATLVGGLAAAGAAAAGAVAAGAA